MCSDNGTYLEFQAKNNRFKEEHLEGFYILRKKVLKNCQKLSMWSLIFDTKKNH